MIFQKLTRCNSIRQARKQILTRLLDLIERIITCFVGRLVSASRRTFIVVYVDKHQIDEFFFFYNTICILYIYILNCCNFQQSHLPTQPVVETCLDCKKYIRSLGLSFSNSILESGRVVKTRHRSQKIRSRRFTRH